MPAVWIFIEGHLGEFSPRRLYGQSVAQSGQIMDAGRPFKFGLEAGSKPELFAALAVHRDPEEMAESLVLVHFHVGSQVPDIGVIKRAVREAARFYANGGLGVDYDGSRTAFESSMNYTLQEYARDVVYNIIDVCDSEKVLHPIIVSAHFIMITQVLSGLD
jgi:arginine decarboxylase